jgi:hypothetical protein
MRWAGEPDKCRCTCMVVATIEETMECPRDWRWVPEIGMWVHA